MRAIDVHGMSVETARRVILHEVEFAYQHNIMTLEVIHGFNNGNKIKRMVLGLTSEDHSGIKSVDSSLLNNGKSIINLFVQFD